MNNREQFTADLLHGASANFAGFGGAIVGTYRNDAAFEWLKTAITAINCRVIKPGIQPSLSPAKASA